MLWAWRGLIKKTALPPFFRIDSILFFFPLFLNFYYTLVMERQSAVGQFSFASLRKFHHGTAECPFSSNREKGIRRIHFLAKRINWNRRELQGLKQEFLGQVFQFWHETRSDQMTRGKVCVCVCGSRGIDIKSWCWKGETCGAGRLRIDDGRSSGMTLF